MKIPKTIHYNGIDYPVKEVERLNGESAWGLTTFKHPGICLESGLSKQRKEEVFIHELMHIAFDHCGLEWDSKKEENAVRVWAKNMYGILSDNGMLK